MARSFALLTAAVALLAGSAAAFAPAVKLRELRVPLAASAKAAVRLRRAGVVRGAGFFEDPIAFFKRKCVTMSTVFICICFIS